MSQSMKSVLKIFHKSLVIDIETVPVFPLFGDLNITLQELWIKKATTLGIPENDAPGAFEERAGIYAEFGKIICIGIGVVTHQDQHPVIRLKAITDNDEKQLLTTFTEILLHTQKQFNTDLTFIGHNIREFDLPYLCRRMIINDLPVPDVLNFSGKKPWEVHCQDTMQLWKFGDYKSYTSLNLLTAVLGIPTPKADISGEEVSSVYWQEHDLPRIARYCLADVLATANVYLKLKNAGNILLQPVFTE